MYIAYLLENGTIKLKNYESDTLTDLTANDDILSLLRLPVELENGFTLYSYFKLLSEYPTLQRLDPYISEYIKTFNEVKLQALNDFTEKEIITVGYSVDVSTRIISNIKDICTISRNKNGLMTHSYDVDNAVYEDRYKVSTAIVCSSTIESGIFSLSQLKDILLLPIQLQTSFQFDCLQSHIPDVFKEKYVDESGISLFDFITAIIYELSFHGSEEDKKKIIEEFDSLTNEMEKYYKDDNED